MAKNYVEKEEFLKYIKMYQEDKNNIEAIEYISDALEKIIKGLLNKKKYWQFVDYNELLMESYIVCFNVLEKFDEDMKSKHKKGKVNPFSYFNSVAYFTMLNILKEHKKISDKEFQIDFENKNQGDGNLNAYDKISFFNSNVKRKYDEKINNTEIKTTHLVKYLSKKRGLFKNKGEKFLEIYDCYMEFIRVYHDYHDSAFKNYLEDNYIKIDYNDLKNFFSYLENKLSLEEVSNILDISH